MTAIWVSVGAGVITVSFLSAGSGSRSGSRLLFVSSWFTFWFTYWFLDRWRASAGLLTLAPLAPLLVSFYLLVTSSAGVVLWGDNGPCHSRRQCPYRSRYRGPSRRCASSECYRRWRCTSDCYRRACCVSSGPRHGHYRRQSRSSSDRDERQRRCVSSGSRHGYYRRSRHAPCDQHRHHC